MTVQQIISEALALPVAQRAELLQALWESLDQALPQHTAGDVICDARKRDAQLTNGEVVGRTHEDVMASARMSLQ